MSERKFEDPYKDVPIEERVKLTTYISLEDAAVLRSVRLIRGTVQTTINLLLKQLIQELKDYGITDYRKRAEFERYVVERSATTLPDIVRDTGADVGHERGGTKGVRSSYKRGKKQQTNDDSRS